MSRINLTVAVFEHKDGIAKLGMRDRLRCGRETPLAKPLLILDIDETLVYATEAPLPGRPHDHQVGPYSVYRRPHLEAFLLNASSDYDLAVWSSASATYVADVVASAFPPNLVLKFVWAADRCTLRYHAELQERFYAKNLKKVQRLGYPLERMLMLDDSPEKLSQHYGNHIRIMPFTGDQNDEELLKLLPFLAKISVEENFRRIEKRHWRQANMGGSK